jgi:protoporphyrinogen oxidase
MTRQRALIIGAGPAGLTAALELLRRTNIQPVVLEATDAIGGISRTIQYKGNRMDIGGHRFFSKSDRVMQWWLDVMPLEEAAANSLNASGSIRIGYQGKQRELHGGLAAKTAASAVAALAGPGPKDPNLVMLLRPRKSRIYFLRRFFDYPIRLTADTLLNLGLLRTFRAGLSYMHAALFPKREELTLEDFLVNRFGRQLYRLFFESYTEKVWGVPCSKISAEWGAQRIKGLSLKGVVLHFLKKTFSRKSAPANANGIAQKQTETSLIEQFLYPKFGPGQLWEHVAEMIQEAGGELHMNYSVDQLIVSGNRLTGVEAISKSGLRKSFAADYVFSTMPVQELVRALSIPPPEEVRAVSEGLVYRDFITVGLLASKLSVHEKDGSPLKDNWIYIQEPDVQVGRLQIFNNWSPSMVADPANIWIGLEYFCYQTESIWKLSDEAMIALATEEIAKIGILNTDDVLDAHVVRVPKTYPAYFGTYDRFDTIRNYTDKIENLFLVGRNGMHKYNNQDHSMLTAMTAVDNIAKGITDKSNLWTINTEMEYHEEK